MRKLYVLVGVITGVGFAYLAFRGIRLDDVKVAVSRADPRLLLIGLFGLALGYIFRIIRWQLLMRHADVPGAKFSKCCGPYLASIGLNNLLPLRAGDIARIAFAKSKFNAPASATLMSLVAERVLDVVMLSSLLVVNLRFQEARSLTNLGYLSIALSMGGIIAIVAAGSASPILIRRFDQIIARLPTGGVLSRTVRFLRETIDRFKLFRSLPLIVLLFALSFMVWFFEGSLVWCVAKALAVERPGLVPWFAMAAGNIATMLPGTPGHFGTFDYFLMLGMSDTGMARSDDAAHAILTHALIWVPTTLVGLGFALETFFSGVSGYLLFNAKGRP